MKRFILGAMVVLLGGVCAVAQTVTVHGLVLSKTDGEPLIGATVLPVSSPSKGVATGLDGDFTLTVPEGENLKVSYVGYMPVTVKAAERMTIELNEDAQALDEVVVVGYTTQKKADLTGAVSVMNMKQPLSENSGNIMSSMQGRMAGVQVTSDAGPGNPSTIRIRGMATVNINDPLYVVDGVPTDNISSLNPSDIESLQVLKDAASASIYGSRAANGVVIVTTKHGRGEKMTVNINYAASLQTKGKTYKMLNAEQWGQAYWTAAGNSNVTPSHPLYGNGPVPQLVQYINGDPNYPVADTDWQDEVYREAWTNNLSVSIANNTEKSSSLFSLNYINQDGTMDYTFYRRYSARVNSRYDFNKWVSVGENLMVAYWQDRGYDTNVDLGIPFTAMRQHPALPVKGLNGDWTSPIALIQSDIENPVQKIYNGRDNNNTSWRIFGNAYLEVRPIDGLTLKSNLGIEHVQFFNKYLTRKMAVSDVPEMSREYGQGDTWTWTNTANYVKSFDDAHFLNVLLGTEAIKYTFENLYGYRKDYAFEDDDYMQLGSGEGVQTNDGIKKQWGLFSLFAKADYNFKNRYYASFTIRRDQSSRLAKDNNSGVFPAFTLAWRPTMEDFFPQNDYLNDMKIRFGWGQNGNQAIDNLYAAFTTYKYDMGNGAYDLWGTTTGQVPGIIVAETGNPDLKWETTTQTNIGLDLSLFNGSLGISADYYIKNTHDMITVPPVLSVAGQDAAKWVNTGDMQNHGWEVTVNYQSPRYGDFSWSGSLNMSQYRNKLVKLNSQVKTIGGDWRLMAGQPMGVYYGYICDGIFQTPEQVANHATQQGAAPGRLIYRDIDGSGAIDENDRCVIGDPNPDLSMGLNLDLKYKDFTLSTFFSGDFGFDIYNTTKRQLEFMTFGGPSTNRSVDLLNAWTEQNPSATIPALALSDDNNETRMSTYYVQDGSYFKMKYIKLAYNLPEQIIRHIGASSLSVFAQMENVFTITKYKGLDPELPLSTYGARVDTAPYPRSKVFTLGVNIQF